MFKFYNLKINASELGDIKSRAKTILLEKAGFDVSAAWTEAVLEFLVNKDVMVLNTTDYYSNGVEK